MSKTDTLTADGTILIPNAIVFGLQLTSIIPDPAPTGDLIVLVKDSDGITDVGTLARMIINRDGMANQNASVTFPAGVRVTKGVNITVTANGHDDILFVCDYS
tara:strand:- start:97 stop:405 length:309 start_codon:yes stop_codon:yes gene_type:complete